MGNLFSAKNREVFSTPISMNNPVTVQVLGICSALAVTSKLEPAIVMGLSVTIITAFSNVVISLIRKTIPNRIRIIVQLVVVAALVTIVSELLKAFAYDVSVQLSVYGLRYVAGFQCPEPCSYPGVRLCEQRLDADAADGVDYRGLPDMVPACEAS